MRLRDFIIATGKVVLVLCILVLLYLFALNGRYTALERTPLIFDNWTGKVLLDINY